MKIAVLNGSFFDDEEIKKLRRLGDEVKVFDNTYTESEAIERLKGVNIAVADCLTTPLNHRVLNSADSLRLLALNTVGYDTVDLNTATRKGIQVANVPGHSTEAVAMHVFALMLAVSNKIVRLDALMRLQPFEIDPANTEHRAQFLGFSPVGKTLGIIGLGDIGQRVAQIGNALGMRVIAYNRSPRNIPGVTMVPLEQLLRESDVVSLHLPLAKETEKIINAERLQMMKPTAILINTSRGGLVDEEALAVALQSHKIAGAGLDVLSNLSPNNPLLKLDNVVLTPHSAFFTQESLKNCAEQVIQNIKSFIEGHPTNIVNLWQQIKFTNLWKNPESTVLEESFNPQKAHTKVDLTA